MEPWNLEDFQRVAISLGMLAALFTFIKGVIEYSNQGKQKRVEQFFSLRKKLKDNSTFRDICALTETDDERLRIITFADKRDLLGLFEEVAIIMNSGLIRKEVAHYMFGYYAIKCHDSENFWHGLNKNAKFWVVYHKFVREMRELDPNYDNEKLTIRI